MTTPSSKVMRISDAPTTVMRLGRGRMAHLVGPDDGARNVDVHINRLNDDAGLGPYHIHERAENVYVVLEGTAQVVIDSRRYLLTQNDIVFIPPGVPHAAGSAEYGPVVLMEIYAPAGPDFTIVEAPATIEDVDRPEITLPTADAQERR